MSIFQNEKPLQCTDAQIQKPTPLHHNPKFNPRKSLSQTSPELYQKQFGMLYTSALRWRVQPKYKKLPSITAGSRFHGHGEECDQWKSDAPKSNGIFLSVPKLIQRFSED